MLTIFRKIFFFVQFFSSELKKKLASVLDDFEFFFMGGVRRPPHPPPGLRPWTPHAFGLRTLVGSGSRSTAFQHEILKIV